MTSTTNKSAAHDAGQSPFSGKKLFRVICASQDGNPEEALGLEVSDGRMFSISDNINRLLADAINNAEDSGDLKSLLTDLEYAANQINWAAIAVRQNFPNV